MTAADLAKANLILAKIQSAVVDGLITESEVLADCNLDKMLSKVFKPNEIRPESLYMLLYAERIAALRGTIVLADMEEDTSELLSLIRRVKIIRKSNVKPQRSDVAIQGQQ